MAALGISQFKDNFQGGARNNLFKVVMGKPPGGGDFDGDALEFLVKTTSLPASTVETLAVPFRGRDLKIAGKRTFEAWSVTVINDQDFKLRSTFESWSAAMSYHDINSSDFSGDAFQGYFVEAQVYQLIHSKNEHKVGYGYNFVDMWPSNIGAVELSSEGEAITEFSVEFQYQYWTSGTMDSETANQTAEVGKAAS